MFDKISPQLTFHLRSLSRPLSLSATMSKSIAVTNPSKHASKKPWHVSRRDLDLDAYRLEQDRKSITKLLYRGLAHVSSSRQFHVYLLLQAIAAWYGVGQVFFCVGILWGFYTNTGTRKEGEMSSWSVFNKDFQACVCPVFHFARRAMGRWFANDEAIGSMGVRIWR